MRIDSWTMCIIVVVSIIGIVSDASPVAPLRCYTKRGAEHLLYRACASTFQCAQHNGITPQEIDIDIDEISKTNGYYNLSFRFHRLGLAIGLSVTQSFSGDHPYQAESALDDIYHVIWQTPIATGLPRLSYTREGVETDDGIDCMVLAKDVHLDSTVMLHLVMEEALKRQEREKSVIQKLRDGQHLADISIANKVIREKMSA